MTTVNLNGNAWVNSDNMGKRLLVKAGWSTGEGIGKNKQGTKTHIKVSIKNEKDGIGLKSEKRKNDISLMQCFTFDSLLKSKYAKFSETSNKKTDKIVERGLSRPKFGRAVSSDFFKPVKAEKWNEILCKAENENPVDNDIIPEIPSENADDTNKFNKSSQTVYEYFTMKMMKKSRENSDGNSKMNNFIFDKISTLKSYLKDEKHSEENPDDMVNEMNEEDVESKGKKKKSKKLKVAIETKIDLESLEGSEEKKSPKLKRTNSEFEVISFAEESQNEVPKKKRKTKKEKSPEDRESEEKQNTENVNSEFEILTIENEISKKKKKSKKAKVEMEVDSVAEIVPIIEMVDEQDPKKKRKSKKMKSVEEETEKKIISSENIQNVEVEESEVSKKKRKSKKMKSQIEEEDKMEIVVMEVEESKKKTKSKNEKPESPNNKNNESSPKGVASAELVEEYEQASKKIPKSAISTEIFEQDKICPWKTSNVANIEGYKYY